MLRGDLYASSNTLVMLDAFGCSMYPTRFSGAMTYSMMGKQERWASGLKGMQRVGSGGYVSACPTNQPITAGCTWLPTGQAVHLCQAWLKKQMC